MFIRKKKFFRFSVLYTNNVARDHWAFQHRIDMFLAVWYQKPWSAFGRWSKKGSSPKKIVKIWTFYIWSKHTSSFSASHSCLCTCWNMYCVLSERNSSKASSITASQFREPNLAVPSLASTAPQQFHPETTVPVRKLLDIVKYMLVRVQAMTSRRVGRSCIFWTFSNTVTCL